MNDKYQSIGTLATGSAFLVGSFVTIGNDGRFPQVIQLTLLAITLAIIITGLIWYFAPIPIPRWIDPRYQYMKRHGMRDENGDPLPQFELSEEEDS